MDKIKRRMLNQLETVKLGDLLRLHCLTVDGCAAYHEGWDDERIREEFNRANGCEITAANVLGLRVVILGHLPKARKPPTLNGMLRRLEALEAWAAERGPGRGDAFRRPE